MDGKPVNYRPQHLFGVVVTANKRTMLNLTLHAGQALEEIGKPVIVTDDVVIVADELARLRKDVNELPGIRKELNEMRQQTGVSARRPAASAKN